MRLQPDPEEDFWEGRHFTPLFVFHFYRQC